MNQTAYKKFQNNEKMSLRQKNETFQSGASASIRSASSNDRKETSTRSQERDDNDKFELKKKIGLGGSVAIIAGTMVGSGIFASPVGVLAGTNGSVGMSLVLWGACGVIAALAALCYAELASMFRDSGAEYAYLYRGYGKLGPTLAFTFSWTSVTIMRNSGNAATAVTLGSYVAAPFYGGDCKPPDVVVKVRYFLVKKKYIVKRFEVRAARDQNGSRGIQKHARPEIFANFLLLLRF